MGLSLACTVEGETQHGHARLAEENQRGCASDHRGAQNISHTHSVILSAAKDLTERSDTVRVAGARSFAPLRTTKNS